LFVNPSVIGAQEQAVRLKDAGWRDAGWGQLARSNNRHVDGGNSDPSEIHRIMAVIFMRLLK